jgi:4-amino-4-deoxy-L-arabinose transferase-like glycosyltransferase
MTTGGTTLRGPRARWSSIVGWAARNRWLLLVVGAYAVSAFVVPTLAPVAVSDDPLHARSVEILMRQGRLEVLPLVVTSLVGQVLWAAPFTWLFGDSLGVMRSATVVAVGLSAFPMYGLLRELHITRSRSALGTALYLFNPLTYSLAFTFMSDGYLAAGIVASAYCFVRAINREGPDSSWIAVGSAVAGLTFLVRQQAVFVVIAVVVWLWITGDLPWNRVGLRRFVRVVAPFVALAALYLFWYHVIHGTPPRSAQVDVSEQWLSADPMEAFVLFRRLTFFEMMYASLFLIPILAAVVPGLRSLARGTTWIGRAAIGAWLVVILLGLVWFGNGNARMPYLSQFVGPSGIGPPNDVHGGRQPLLSPTGQDWLTGVCVVAAIILAIVLFSRLGTRSQRPAQRGVGAVIALLVGQGVAAVISSYPLRDTAISRDRYLLPLVPLVIALALWCVRGVRLVAPIAWSGVVLFAAVSIGGVHDFLSFQSTVWQTAAAAHRSGVPYRSLDGGAAWDAYHLYEYSYKNDVHLEFPTHLSKREIRTLKRLKLSKNDSDPWWIGYYAPATNGEYVVSAEPLLSYRVVSTRTWYSWFRQDGQTVYLLKKRH